MAVLQCMIALRARGTGGEHWRTPLCTLCDDYRKGADLNRDFPGVLNLTSGHRIPPPLLAGGSEQPETAAVMAWASSRTFIASAAMHEARPNALSLTGKWFLIGHYEAYLKLPQTC